MNKSNNSSCKVCGHPKRNHRKLVLHDPQGNPYPARVSCNCVAGNARLGSILCGCNGKKALGLEMVKRMQLA